MQTRIGLINDVTAISAPLTVREALSIFREQVVDTTWEVSILRGMIGGKNL